MNNKSFDLRLKSEASIPLRISGFTETDSKNIEFASQAILSCTPSFSIQPQITFSVGHDFEITNTVANTVTYTVETYALVTNCWGYGSNSSFFTDNADTPKANPIRVGNYNGFATKAWLPFTVDFGARTGGIKIVSATLSINLFEACSIPNSTKPSKIKYGVDKVINSIAPTSWRSLSSKIMSTSYGKYNIVSDLASNYTHDLDLTNLMGDVFGKSGGIVWNNGDNLAIILSDLGSYANEHIALTSYQGQIDSPEFTRAKLTIVAQDIYYGYNLRSTWISSAKPTLCNPNNPQMFVGEPNNGSTKNRTLLYIDLSAIPDGATVTSATLYLYLEARQSAKITNFQIYKLLSDKNWDMNTASWNKRYGTQAWTTAGAMDDCDPTAIITQSFAKAEALGYKTFDVTATAQDWVTNPLNNKGILLKTSIEANDGYIFSSRFTSKPDTQRPKLLITYTYNSQTYTDVEFS